MKFIQTFKQSFYSPQFYRELKHKNFWFSLKYFYSLVLILAFVSAVTSSIFVLPMVKTLMQKVEPFLRSYPSELAVTIQDGRASTNVEEPYFVEMPQGFCDLTDEIKEDDFCKLTNVVTIDTKTPFSISKMEEYKTLAWLTSDSMVIRQGAETKITALKDVPNTVIDKQLMDGLADKTAKIVKRATPIVLPVTAVLIFLAYIVSLSKLVYLLFGALIVLLIANIKKVEMTYGYAYRIGLHAVTLGVILNFLGNSGLPSVPFLFTIIFAVCAWVNIEPQKIVAEVAPVTPVSPEETPVT